jgi:protein TonB
MTTLSFTTQNRIRGGAIALLVEGLIGYGLILGFSVDIPAAVGEQLKIFNLAAPKPPPPIVTRPKPHPTHNKKTRGAASPRNIKSKATEIVAPELPAVVPPPVTAAPKPFIGNQASTGATRQRGPGTGAGGLGNGTGSGGSGEGEGDDDRPPKWKSGKVKASDFHSVVRVPGNYSVSVVYVVQIDGRATNCIASRSSGNPGFDQTVCRLIEERYRFKPAQDGAGRPFAAKRGEDHTLTFEVEDVTTRVGDREDRDEDR